MPRNLSRQEGLTRHAFTELKNSDFERVAEAKPPVSSRGISRLDTAVRSERQIAELGQRANGVGEISKLKMTESLIKSFPSASI
jgi:hypothetical protein